MVAVIVFALFLSIKTDEVNKKLQRKISLEFSSFYKFMDQNLINNKIESGETFYDTIIVRNTDKLSLKDTINILVIEAFNNISISLDNSTHNNILSDFRERLIKIINLKKENLVFNNTFLSNAILSYGKFNDLHYKEITIKNIQFTDNMYDNFIYLLNNSDKISLDKCQFKGEYKILDYLIQKQNEFKGKLITKDIIVNFD